MQACFGVASIAFVSIPALVAWSSIEYYRINRVSLFGSQVLVVYAIPLVFSALYGMAWWAVKRAKRSARAWAIVASSAMLLLGILLVVGAYVGARPDSNISLGSVVFSGLVPAFGIAGLAAFVPHTARGLVKPPKPSRIAGDGTSRFLDVLALLVGIGGILVVISLCYRWGYEQTLPVASGYMPWLWILIAASISTALHEFGHAVVGLALGMRLRAFIVGPFEWRIRDGIWKFQFLPAKFIAAGGATAVVPTDPNQSDWNEICMIAAGPLASLISGLISLEIALCAKGASYEKYWEMFVMIAAFSLDGFAVNLIPFLTKSPLTVGKRTYSDGAQIYQLLSGGPWRDLHRIFRIVGSTAVTPLRPRDFDIQAIQRAASTFTQGYQALALRLIATSYFIDCGKMGEARQALVDAETIYRESVPDISVELCMSFVFQTALLSRDAVGAREWWGRVALKKPTHLGADHWLARSALLWIEGQLKEADEAWSEGNRLAQRLPAAGDCEFDRYRCTLLRQALDEEPIVH